ncbi:MAG: toll/interleukin-1 receptor domain-containing protein, partial [Azoarcus sp.]|nr:toll/interleukin-1 receptor domain-containing protein [Azoarcus sp.]
MASKRVFLNYNSENLAQVERLGKDLEMRGLEVYLDKREIRPGETDVAHRLAKAIRDIDTFIACVGWAGISETWQKREQGIAIGLAVRDERRRTILVYLPGATVDYYDPATLALCPSSFIHFDDHNGTEQYWLNELVKAIMGEPESELAAAGVAPADANNPYPGLKSFDLEKRQWFFGRECQTNRLVERIRFAIVRDDGLRLLMLVGASGSGKSSLAKAGLFAALQNGAIEGAQGWKYAILRPGSDPVQKLADEAGPALGLDEGKQHAFADALRDPSANECVLHDMAAGKGKLILLVDQFEEIFTVCEDKNARRIFVDNLLYAANATRHTDGGPVIAVLTLRNDFTNRLAAFPGMLALLDRCQESVGPMSSDEL